MRATCTKFGSEMPTGSRCYWEAMAVRHDGRVTRHGSFNRRSGFADLPVSSHPTDALWGPDACSFSGFPTCATCTTFATCNSGGSG